MTTVSECGFPLMAALFDVVRGICDSARPFLLLFLWVRGEDRSEVARMTGREREQRDR